MDDTTMRRANAPSQSLAAFEMMCEGADLVSSIWQPMLKSIGRWHLEVAGLGVKQTQAALQLSRDLTRCMTPGDFASAHIRYWDAVTSQYAQSSQRLAATTARTIAQPLEASEIVTLRVKSRSHDLIVIPEDLTANKPDRKVA